MKTIAIFNDNMFLNSLPLPFVPVDGHYWSPIPDSIHSAFQLAKHEYGHTLNSLNQHNHSRVIIYNANWWFPTITKNCIKNCIKKNIPVEFKQITAVQFHSFIFTLETENYTHWIRFKMKISKGEVPLLVKWHTLVRVLLVV